MQAFILTVLLMPTFEERLSFQMLQNAGGGLRVLQALHLVYGRVLVVVKGVKTLKNVDLFTFGRQINSLK